MSLSMTVKPHDQASVFAYHVLRCSVDRYAKPLQQLDQRQHEDVLRRAKKSYALESLVLGSPEARNVVIPDADIDRSVNEIRSRYDSEQAFVEDLESNELSSDILRQALRRELIFNAVMETVASRSATTSDLDVRVFYELHRDRFSSPETRMASHILITVNPEYQENTPDQALSRIRQLAEKLQKNPNRFAALAKKHSECPTALEGGSLGTVQRGTLYPELDAALFSMQQGSVSDVVETELGYHLIWCEKITKQKVLPLSKAYDRIRQNLDDRKRRTCQKAWIKQLQERSEND